MKSVAQVINLLEQLAPNTYAEKFDNVGLLIGNSQQKVSAILVCLDVTEKVLNEAIAHKSNLIVAFHPIIFSGLKEINGSSYVEKCVIKAIKNDIAIYAIHTSLDNQFLGVNNYICEALGLIDRKILIPQKHTIKKLTTYCPIKNADKVRQALFDVGAGAIGNYSNCSFNHQGIGTFLGNQQSNPQLGKKGKLHYEEEIAINVVFEKHIEHKIIQNLIIAHPYEEVAYEIISIDKDNPNIGMGMYGNLQIPTDELSFIKKIKNTFNASCVRHSKFLKKPIKKIAVLAGSGSFAIENAKKVKADIFITADIKYHDFFKAEEQIIIADVGHYESEWIIKSRLFQYLNEKIPNIAIILSKIDTNPVNYL